MNDEIQIEISGSGAPQSQEVKQIVLSESDKIRFEKRFERPADPKACWIWKGSCFPDGYGQFFCDKKNRRAPRVSYTLYRGPIPDGMLICHTCDTPLCVNPDHLWVGTNAENLKDMTNKGRKNAPTGELHWANRKPYLVLRGEQKTSAKFTDDDIREIRKIYANGGITQQELADRYGVVRTIICRIINKKRWAHVL